MAASVCKKTQIIYHGETSDKTKFPLSKDLESYGTETTLHGLKYICQPERHSCEKMFWTISFLSSFVVAGFLVYGVCVSYMKNPVVVTSQVKETQISSVPFPAVTVCNVNRIRKSRVEQYIRLANQTLGLYLESFLGNQTGNEELGEQLKISLKNLKCIDSLCSFPQLLGSSSDDSKRTRLYDSLIKDSPLSNFLRPGDIKFTQIELDNIRTEGQHSCKDLVIYCEWNGKVENCSELFQVEYLGPEDGDCCIFNNIWPIITDDKPEESRGVRMLENFDEIRIQNRGGRAEGLTVVLNPELDEYYCSPYTGPGFFFTIHNPLDEIDLKRKSFPVSPNIETFVSISPKVTFADPDIKWFGVENRQCYFPNEPKLEYFETYTKFICMMECEERMIVEKCGCYTSFIRFHSIPRNACSSDFKDQHCVLDTKSSILSKPVSDLCPQCLPNCNDIEYEEFMTGYQISDRNSKYYTGEDREYYQKWINHSVSILHVYFKDDSFYAKERRQLYSFSDLIANIGGLLGLCLGFSGLSLVELGYFFCIRPCFKQRNVNVD